MASSVDKASSSHRKIIMDLQNKRDDVLCKRFMVRVLKSLENRKRIAKVGSNRPIVVDTKESKRSRNTDEGWNDGKSDIGASEDVDEDQYFRLGSYFKRTGKSTYTQQVAELGYVRY
ncbi:hypothetical protein WN51_10794 [Melipona quadrifasciata]|uniref:Uncharacterized protein n=1 Tax=Melipona quadrifasciata TaxID=166423 RepID=A0A0N0BI00_9HYME|nr:hypothetical protein WN51_10794 [Melipona quadrifasciata]